MKRIILLLITALILMPTTANAELETNTYYDTYQDHVSLSYKLDSNKTGRYLLPSLIVHLKFSFKMGETLNVTSFKLNCISIKCLSVLEAPDWNESSRTTMFELYDHDQLLISGIFSTNITFERYQLSDWGLQNYTLLALNLENVTLVTCLLFTFSFQFTYEITRNIETTQDPLDLLSIIVLVAIGSFIVGAVFATGYCRYYNSVLEQENDQ